MGKCIKCGKETIHSYNYFSKDLNDSHFKAHLEYMCTKCILNPLGVLLFSIGLAVFAIIMLMAKIFGEINSSLILFILSGFGSVLFLFSYLASMKKINNDKRSSEEAGSRKLIQLKSKINNLKTYLTYNEYKRHLGTCSHNYVHSHTTTYGIGPNKTITDIYRCTLCGKTKTDAAEL